MSMKVKAMILLLVFGAILFLPFAVHAGSGTLFEGLPIPDFNDSAAVSDDSAEEDESAATEEYDAAAAQYADGAAAAQYVNCPPPAGDGGTGLNAAQEQYAASLPKPELNSASVQQPISIDDMRRHMDLLQEDGRSTEQCLACHTNRADFCDRCHSYSGVNPTFD